MLWTLSNDFNLNQIYLLFKFNFGAEANRLKTFFFFASSLQKLMSSIFFSSFCSFSGEFMEGFSSISIFSGASFFFFRNDGISR